MLAIIETHPIQYRAPVYRFLHQELEIPLTVVYGSDFSVAGYRDKEFGATFAWDTDLLSGYDSTFLARTSQGGPTCFSEVTAKGLTAALGEINPKAVLLTGYQHRLYRAAIFQAWKSKYPLLFRAETTDHAIKRHPLKQLVRDSALQWLYHRCHRLLHIGEYSKQHFLRLGCSDEKLISSPYCIDPSPFQIDEKERETLRRETRKKLGILDSQVVLLFSGKLSERKRPDLIIKAVRRLPDEIRNRILILFLGDGNLRDNLAQEASVKPAIKAQFLGFQNQAYLSRYYHSADILVLPSQSSETWGLVVNEALHHGLPAVVSEAVGCHKNLIVTGKTGEIFSIDSPEELALALRRSLTLINKNSIRQQCREVVNDYSIKNAALGICCAYNQVISS